MAAKKKHVNIGLNQAQVERLENLKIFYCLDTLAGVVHKAVQDFINNNTGVAIRTKRAELAVYEGTRRKNNIEHKKNQHEYDKAWEDGILYYVRHQIYNKYSVEEGIKLIRSPAFAEHLKPIADDLVTSFQATWGGDEEQPASFDEAWAKGEKELCAHYANAAYTYLHEVVGSNGNFEDGTTSIEHTTHARGFLTGFMDRDYRGEVIPESLLPSRMPWLFSSYGTAPEIAAMDYVFCETRKPAQLVDTFHKMGLFLNGIELLGKESLYVEVVELFYSGKSKKIPQGALDKIRQEKQRVAEKERTRNKQEQDIERWERERQERDEKRAEQERLEAEELVAHEAELEIRRAPLSRQAAIQTEIEDYESSLSAAVDLSKLDRDALQQLQDEIKEKVVSYKRQRWDDYFAQYPGEDFIYKDF